MARKTKKTKSLIPQLILEQRHGALNYLLEDADVSTFDEFWSKNKNRIIGMAENFFKYNVNADTDAEILANEVAIKVWQGIENYKKGGNPEHWVSRIARNHLIDTYRRQKRLPENKGDEELNFSMKGATKGKALDSIIAKEQLALAMQVLEGLPDEIRKPIYYCDILGFDYKEAQEACGVDTEGTFKSRLHRGREIFRERLREKNIG